MSEQLDSWLANRNPAPHPRLVARMRDAARDVAHDVSGSEPALSLPALTRAASLRILGSVLDSPPSERGGSTALDLLSADALMTYSCEAACENAHTLEDEAAANIASVVELMQHRINTAEGSA